MADVSTSGGGIHPGAPIIWPTSKNTPTSTQSTTQQQSQQTQSTAQQSSSSQAATQASTASSAAATTLPAASSAATSSAPVRQLTVNDVKAHLLSLQMVDSDANVKLASMMLKFGIELSRTNFMKALAMLEGTDKAVNTQEAALVLLSKGVDQSPEAVRMLAAQLSENPTISSQTASVKAALQQLSGTLTMNPQMFSPALMAQLTTLVSQFNAMLDDLPKKYKFTSGNIPEIGRDELVNSVRAMKSLLDGIQEKSLSKESKATSESQAMSQAIMTGAKKLDSLLDNLLSQVLLSQSSGKDSLGKSEYLYYQIPNSMITPPSSVDIIIKKDGGKNAAVDLANTQIMLGLETEALGKMVISVSLKDKQANFLFNTELEETKKLVDKENIQLKKNLSDKGYEVKDCQARTSKSACSIKPYLIPILGLDHLFKINSVI